MLQRGENLVKKNAATDLYFSATRTRN